MKILIFGAKGFIGKAVSSLAKQKGLDVFEADINIDEDKNQKKIDLFDENSIKKALIEIKPDYIINCSGTVENSEKAITTNPVFSLNIIKAVVDSKIKSKKIIIIGSASEYGEVKMEDLPVGENQPLAGKTHYALSKIIETSTSLFFAQKYNLPVVVARMFNPIGTGMNPKFLIPNLIAQARSVKDGKKTSIEINRLDSSRDYLGVLDTAEALLALMERDTKELIYNIGSGKKTENKVILNMILEELAVNRKTDIKELETEPETIYAISADISRIKRDTSWQPKTKLSQVIKEIVREYE